MSYARFHNDRRQNVRLLSAEIKPKIRRRLRRASIGIVGAPQTGKKTLARRFGAMNQGPFEEEIQSRYYYLAYIDLDTRPSNGTGDLFLKSYILPPPSDLPVEDPPSYYSQVDYFSALIFVCSVTDKPTFMNVVDRLHELRDIFVEGLPYFLLVGTKMDLDRSIYPQHLTFSYGLLTAHSQFGASYEECSAKQNINVDIILERIIIEIIADQP